MFSKMGSKLVDLLGGDSFTAERSSFQESWETLSQFQTFSDFLPFESFDETTQLFYQQASLGFVLETLPLVGSSSQMQKEIANLFQQMMPQESSLQVLLWADPHIGEITKRYAQARSNASPILQTLAGQRARFLENLSFNASYSPYQLRTFRCFLSASKSTGSSVRTTEEELARLKQQMTTTLEMLGLPVHVWQAGDLLSFLEGLLNHQSLEIDPPKRPWNPHQLLREQVFKGTSLLEVESDSLLLNDLKVRTYSVRHFPQTWSLHAMGELIGDMERDQAQIPCPFMIHYGVYIPKQDRPKTKVLAKATYVERQAFSSLGKYIPSLQRESEELQFVRSQLAKEERIVQTHLGVTLFSKPEGLNNAEQILLNLFASKEWKLERNRFLHLPMLLSALPMMWGEDKVKALLHLRKLKTTLSTESSNLLPLQGEWHGTPTPGMIFWEGYF